jgi:hypothetical protein
LPSPSARPAWCATHAWRSLCGTGISASTASGAACSQPNARHCAAGHTQSYATKPLGNLSLMAWMLTRPAFLRRSFAIPGCCWRYRPLPQWLSRRAVALPAPPPAARGAALTMRHTSLGTILTNGQGFTLYAFEADHGTMSSCSGVCATSWPPVTAANIKVTGGAAKSLVRETTRPGGAPGHLRGAPVVPLRGRRQPPAARAARARMHSGPAGTRLHRQGGNHRLGPAAPPLEATALAAVRRFCCWPGRRRAGCGS